MTIHNLYLPRLLRDDDLNTIKGEYLDDEWIHHIIDYDCNIYDEETNTLICAFRKRRLKQSALAWTHYKDLSVAARGRGAAAGGEGELTHPIPPTPPIPPFCPDTPADTLPLLSELLAVPEGGPHTAIVSPILYGNANIMIYLCLAM